MNLAPLATGLAFGPVPQSFSPLNVSNDTFVSGFTPGGITWDPSRERLIIVGKNSGGPSIYVTDRKGVIIGKGFTTSVGANLLTGVAVKTSGSDILALDTAGNKVYSLTETGNLTPTTFRY